MEMSLTHFALGIPDLKTGADFYTAFGLNMREGNGRLGFRCDNRPHDEIVLVENGDRRKFHHLGFSTDAAGFARVEKNLKSKNVALSDPPWADAADGLWFRDPDGNLVNVHTAEQTGLEPETPPVINGPGNLNRLNERGCPPFDIDPRPRRFGHMILFAPDPERQAQFYIDVMGMQLSDRITGNFAVFLRTAGDADHHVLGFLMSPVTGFHHASFEVGSIDEAAVAARRVVGSGYRHAWGPGRHGVGSNYFHYFRDPWNGMAEYFWDIDFITADHQWAADEWTKKDGMFLWAADGPPPEDFGRNYEAD